MEIIDHMSGKSRKLANEKCEVAHIKLVKVITIRHGLNKMRCLHNEHYVSIEEFFTTTCRPQKFI